MCAKYHNQGQNWDFSNRDHILVGIWDFQTKSGEYQGDWDGWTVSKQTGLLPAA